MAKSLGSSLLKKAASYLSADDVSVIEHAIKFAQNAHHGQFRKSKQPYISHPIEVATILCELEQDMEIVVGGLLHDTIEDTKVSELDIKEIFGDQIESLVVGVTKLNKLSFGSREEAQAENYRRLFLAMAEDVGVVIIKLADRLHNLRTLSFLSKEKQLRIAQESLDIYAPLAHRLGIATLKWEIEDLSFLYTHSEEYHQIKELLEMNHDERERYIQDMMDSMESFLKGQFKYLQITGRPKHLYSIYKKIHLKGISFDELYDLLGIRIIVESVTDCYAALGLIHSKFKPVSERFKDYIALPKPNGYQSLHTTVIGPDGKMVEIQLRTPEMQHTSEFGLAAHWHYKQTEKPSNFKGELKWLTQIIEDQSETLTPLDYVQTLKVDLYMDEVYVFTPKGDLKVFRKQSTALDFAYSIHTEIGHCCKGALVNGEIVPLDYELQNGDRVEVLTSKTPHPKVDWLHMVVSRHARYKIKQWLNRQNKEDLIVQGKRRLEKSFFSQGLMLTDLLKQINQKDLKDRFHLSKIDDLFLYVEQGDLAIQEVIRYFVKQLKQKLPDEEPVIKETGNAKKLPSHGVHVLGEKNIKFTLAKCCSPIPGDDIEGIVVIGKGVSVHRVDCVNLVTVQKNTPERVVEVNWDQHESAHIAYNCIIKIEGYDRPGILQDILNIIYDAKINLREVSTKVTKDNTRMHAIMSLDLKGIKAFYELKKRFMSIQDVYNVSRVSVGFGS